MESYYTQSVNEWYVSLLRENQQKHSARLAALKTREDAVTYRQNIREKIRKYFALPSALPVPTGLSCGVIRHKGYQVEKMIYEIRPGDFVTANIFRPDNPVIPAPAVLFLCGHSQNGKADSTYQTCCAALALNGCIVLTFDPSGQGERQLYTKGAGADMKNRPVWQHNMIARQMDLVGWSYSSWCLYDTVRMLDVLCAMPGVDPRRIGVTGNSGGGNMSAYLTAVDDRPAAVAPSCYLTTWLHNIENELPACAEQIPPGLVGAGCEMSDLIIAAAPRPHLILGQRNDFFDPRGTLETYEKVLRFYELLGEKDKLEYFIGPYSHGYYDSNRAAMYRFFSKHLGFEWRVPEPDESTADAEEKLLCTVTGNVLDFPNAKHPRDFVAEEARRLAEVRKATPWLQRKEALGKILEVDRVKIPYFRVLRVHSLHPEEELYYGRFGLETEPGHLMAILYRPYNIRTCFHPGSNADSITLYIPHRNAIEELYEIGGNASEWYALDMRGVGALTPGSCDTYTGGTGKPEYHETQPEFLNLQDQHGRNAFGYYGYDYHYWSCGIMLGRPYLGGRVRDILAAMKLLAANGVKEIRLVGSGQGVLPAALAALYFKDCKLKTEWLNAPESFDAMMALDVVPWPHSGLVTGLLKYLDLPELYLMTKQQK